MCKMLGILRADRSDSRECGFGEEGFGIRECMSLGTNDLGQCVASAGRRVGKGDDLMAQIGGDLGIRASAGPAADDDHGK